MDAFGFIFIFFITVITKDNRLAFKTIISNITSVRGILQARVQEWGAIAFSVVISLTQHKSVCLIVIYSSTSNCSCFEALD